MAKVGHISPVNLLQKWRLDFATSKALKEVRQNDVALNPPGYCPNAVHLVESSANKEADQQHLLMKRAWDLALGPLKQLPMNVFIMFMAGNSISIFPIMMVGMMFIRPMQALVKVGSTFKPLEGPLNSMMLFQKFLFILGNLVGLGVALYKCSSMGLLPTHQSDWLAFIEEPVRTEYSTGGISL